MPKLAQRTGSVSCSSIVPLRPWGTFVSVCYSFSFFFFHVAPLFIFLSNLWGKEDRGLRDKILMSSDPQWQCKFETHTQRNTSMQPYIERAPPSHCSPHHLSRHTRLYTYTDIKRRDDFKILVCWQMMQAVPIKRQSLISNDFNNLRSSVTSRISWRALAVSSST